MTNISRGNIVKEIFLLRSVACLSIILLHSINRIYTSDDEYLTFFKLMLTFGTPAFVFISEFVLSYSYPQSTPDYFWKKRVNYILVPYISVGAFYAVMDTFMESNGLIIGTLLSKLFWYLILGDFSGYFVLIIFQFYLLHFFFQKYLNRVAPLKVILSSLLINAGYLLFFNFTKPMNFPLSEYIWSTGYWMPFFGWVFYFAVAYYCGRNYEYFVSWLKRNIILITVLGLAAIGVSFWIQLSGILVKVSSKRIDMIFSTLGIVFMLFYIALKLPSVPRVLVWISRYSFGIYLIHNIYMAILFMFVARLPFLQNNLLGVLFLMIGCILLSVWTIHLMNKLRWGAYLIGKVGVGLGTKPPGRVNV